MRIGGSTLIKLLLFASVMIYSLSGCHQLPNNGVPVYLHIDSATVLYNPAFGSASHNIPDVWVTSGATTIGAFQTPVDIPILAGGNVPIAVSAGIYDNGIVNTPVQYPFYAPDTFTIYHAIPGHVYHHKPAYYYYAFTQVGLNADFESVNPFTNMSIMTNQADSNVFEGLKSGGIILSSTADSLTALQTVPVVINTNGRQAYVELNYRINNPNTFLDVGIIATLYSGGQISEQTYYDKILLTPLGYWNKTYLNFNNEIGGNANYSFQIYLTGYHTPGQQDTVFVDNVKLLYFH